MKEDTKEIEALRNAVAIQTQSAYYDEYMRGMANGLICALSIMTGEEPKYLDAPLTP